MVRTFDAPIIANDQSLDRLLDIPIPLLLVFWNGRDLTDEMNQTMLRLASHEAGLLIIAKINVRDNPAATRRFEVRGTPLAVGLRQGEEVTRVAAATAADIHEQALFLLGRIPRPARHGSTNTERQTAVNQPITVTDATFERQVLQSSLPVLVDFWASWCVPCRMIASTLEKLAGHYAGRLIVAKVNVDENPYYAGVYGVQGIPTLLMIVNGQVVDRITGAVPEAHLRAEIERNLLRH